jgi:hypothetical protein
MKLDMKYQINVVELRKMEDQMTQLEIKGWLEYEFLTWNWWLLAAFMVVPWLIWFMLYKKNALIQCVLFGSLICLITTILDVAGLQLRFWDYPTKLIPIAPRAFPFDLAMVPVAYMLMYQYFTTWKSYIIAQVAMAAAYAFIGEPFSHGAELVNYINWSYLYSFIYYILVGITTRLFVRKIDLVTRWNRV